MSKEKCDCFKRYLRLEYGIALYDSVGRVFAAIDAEALGTAFRSRVSSIPQLGEG